MTAPVIEGVGVAPADPLKVPRDWRDRPLVVSPEAWAAKGPAGKAEAYTRVTTYIKAIESAEGLAMWREAMVLLGAGFAPMALLKIHRQLAQLENLEPWTAYRLVKADEREWTDDDGESVRPKKAMWKAVDALKRAAGIDEASAWGTLVHSATEEWERHEGARTPAQVVAGIEHLISEYVETVGRGCARKPDPQRTAERLEADVAGYARMRSTFAVLAVERFVGIPQLKVGGTLDRHIGFDGLVAVGDLKTGDSATSFPAKLALQLGCYAGGRPYDPVNGWGAFPYEVSRTWGLVFHFPGDGRCVAKWVKIAKAWHVVESLIPQARAWETYASAARILRDFDPAVGVPRVDAADELPLLGVPSSLEAAIRTAESREYLVELWRRYDGARWPQALVELATARTHELSTGAVAQALGGEVVADDQGAAA